MAEFQEVMRNRRRICATYDDCDECPCRLFCDKTIMDMNDHDNAGMEQVILQWAAEHPEPRYPTWKEWQDTNFPDAAHNVCPRAYMTSERWPCIDRACAECRTHEIPADIAKKLGIEPIGGENHD